MALESEISTRGGLRWRVLFIGAVAFGVAFLLRTFLFQPFLVHGASMEPTFEDGEYLLIDEISYAMRDPARGEVIVFRFPQNEAQFFIKRIVGLPGETVEITRGRITVRSAARPEGFALQEPYIQYSDTTIDLRVTLGEREYFVLGDNRTVSFDSRRWGAVPRRDIIGRVWVRAWPVAKAAVFSAPAY